MRSSAQFFTYLPFIAIIGIQATAYFRLRGSFDKLYSRYMEVSLRSCLIERQRDEARRERDAYLLKCYRPEPTEKSV